MKSVLCHFEGRDLSQFWEPPRMHNCCHSILVLSPDSDTPRIAQYAGHTQGFGVDETLVRV